MLARFLYDSEESRLFFLESHLSQNPLWFTLSLCQEPLWHTFVVWATVTQC